MHKVNAQTNINTVNNKVTNQHRSCQQKYKCVLVKNKPGIREKTRNQAGSKRPWLWSGCWVWCN